MNSSSINNEEILDPHYIGYNMIIQALSHESIYERLKQALYFAKVCIKADDIILFKKEENGSYAHYSNNALMNNNSTVISIILNKAKDIIERKDYFNFNINVKNENKKVMFIPIVLDNSKYVITISNPQTNIEKDNYEFVEVMKKSMRTILKELESYDNMLKNSMVDRLTGLDNRNSYEKKIKIVDEDSVKVVYAIFDLFRLKYINDNYGHLYGDRYIQGAANILKRYFPKYDERNDENGAVEKIYTGSCIYRTGGDEFVLITDSESMEMVEAKAKLAREELSMLNLGIEEEVPIGLNYGIASRTNNESVQELYVKADELLSQDKTRMYQEKGIDRRK